MNTPFRLLAALLVMVSSVNLFGASRDLVAIGKQKADANRVLARFKASSSPTERAQALQNHRASVHRAYSLMDGLVSLDLAAAPALNSTLPVPAKTDQGKQLLRRIRALMDTGVFEYVEPDYIMTIDATPSDSAYGNGTLWGLNNTGASGGIAGADIEAAEAWDITTGSPNVVVGVIDTGIRYTHQDLAAQMWSNPDEIPNNGVDDDNDGYVDNVHGINSIIGSGNPMDDNDHGTHVSGTIAAQANGGGPHVGVAWGIKLMGLKFLDANGSGNTSDAIECVNFARLEKGRLGASCRMILNNSWGGGGFSSALKDAIAASRNAGILFVAAAGNDGTDNDQFPHYPSNYDVDSVVSVAAVDRSDQIASFSNRGAATVHLGAPGVAIYSCNSQGDALYSTFSGTSMATPHVAGVAALIWSKFPAASLTEVRQRLLVGTVPIQALSGKTFTGGRLNANKALTIQPDNNLELFATVEGGLQVVPGTTIAVRVSVSDIFPINNAIITGSLSSGGNLTFKNDGVSPDATANDNVYSANMTVPTGVATLSINIAASATGKNNASTSIPLTVLLPPPNDMFANRQVVTSLPALLTGSNRDATAEPGEPNFGGESSGKSVWWSWTAPQSGVASASTEGSTFDTMLGVYTGNSIGALALVGSNDDVVGAYTSKVLFPVTAGLTYQFIVDGWWIDEGEIQFNLELSPTLTNDNFANRTRISGLNQTFYGYNMGATKEIGEPPHIYLPDRSVWWEWDSGDYLGSVRISTAGSSFDTALGVYTGNQFNNLSLLAANDDVLTDRGLYQSEVAFTCLPNTKYQIVVDSAWLDDGAVHLTIAGNPDNDNFYSPRTLSGEFANDFAHNVGATGQTGEPDYDFFRNDAKSVWWSWTAPKSGKVVITTDGSPFDTRLFVYTGNLVNELTEVAFNDDRSSRIFTSIVTFGAVAGTTYHIRVDGYYWYTTDPFGELADYWVEDGTINLQLSMDGASRLSPPVLREDNTLSLELLGEPERPYVLSGTSDFVTWNPVSTNTPISRRIFISQPAPAPGEKKFFRAQPASLVTE